MQKTYSITGRLRAITFQSFREEKDLFKSILKEHGMDLLLGFKERHEYLDGSIVITLK